MKDKKVIVARTISVISFVFVGTLTQTLLWKKSGSSYFDALSHWPFLWIIYFFIALLIGEHSLRLMKKK
jgi:hypothetical protein